MNFPSPDTVAALRGYLSKQSPQAIAESLGISEGDVIQHLEWVAAQIEEYGPAVAVPIIRHGVNANELGQFGTQWKAAPAVVGAVTPPAAPVAESTLDQQPGEDFDPERDLHYLQLRFQELTGQLLELGVDLNGDTPVAEQISNLATAHRDTKIEAAKLPQLQRVLGEIRDTVVALGLDPASATPLAEQVAAFLASQQETAAKLAEHGQTLGAIRTQLARLSLDDAGTGTNTLDQQVDGVLQQLGEAARVPGLVKEIEAHNSKKARIARLESDALELERLLRDTVGGPYTLDGLFEFVTRAKTVLATMAKVPGAPSTFEELANAGIAHPALVARSGEFDQVLEALGGHRCEPPVDKARRVVAELQAAKDTAASKTLAANANARSLSKWKAIGWTAIAWATIWIIVAALMWWNAPKSELTGPTAAILAKPEFAAVAGDVPQPWHLPIEVAAMMMADQEGLSSLLQERLWRQMGYTGPMPVVDQKFRDELRLLVETRSSAFLSAEEFEQARFGKAFMVGTRSTDGPYRLYIDAVCPAADNRFGFCPRK